MSKLIVCGVPDELKALPVVNPAGTRRLDVTCEHVTTALQGIRRLPGVRTATVFGQSMHLLVDESMSEERLRRELASRGIARADIHGIGPSLEDVFVALTQESNNGQLEEHSYPGMGHSVSLDEIADLARFLQRTLQVGRH